MGRFDDLLEKANQIGQRILEVVKEKKSIKIVSHLDADGIVSASLVASLIIRKKGRFVLKIVSDLTPQLIERVAEEGYDLYIFADLGGGMIDEIRKRLESRWLVVDHHQISKEELDQEEVFNCWQFGFDGGRDISCAGMTYYIAKQSDAANIDLSYLPVIAALADRQDQGKGRSLVGINRSILKDGIDSGRLSVSTDLVIYGRETKPIHEAIAATTIPFLPGLTGNRHTCLAALSSIGVPLQQNGRWRTFAQLSDEEKRKVMEVIVPYLAPTSKAEVLLNELIGEVYILEKEDEYSPLRDGREFATLLNACGRMKKSGVGVAICMGDRNQAVQEAEKILSEYRQSLGRYVETLLNDETRISDKAGVTVINGDGVVDEEMLGALASVLSTIQRFDRRVVLVRATSRDGMAKFSARRAIGCDTSINLGSIMKNASERFGGFGGGHDAAAGAKIPISRIQQFLKTVFEMVQSKNEEKS